MARNKRNKAGYTATSVACGWAGAVIELLVHFGKSGEAKDRKNIKKVKLGPTDQPTDGQSGVWGRVLPKVERFLVACYATL